MKDALRFLILHEIQSLSTDSINDVEGGTYEIEFTTYEELWHKYFPYIPLLDKAKAALFDDDWAYFILANKQINVLYILISMMRALKQHLTLKVPLSMEWKLPTVFN